MADLDLDRWYDIAQAATPGPLTIRINPDLAMSGVDHILIDESEHTVSQYPHCENHPRRTLPDARLHQIARDAIVALANEVAALRREIATLRPGEQP
jgi:hypothetical protein